MQFYDFFEIMFFLKNELQLNQIASINCNSFASYNTKGAKTISKLHENHLPHDSKLIWLKYHLAIFYGCPQ